MENWCIGDDDTGFAGCAFKNTDVRPTNQLFVPRRTRLHAVILGVGLNVSRRKPPPFQSSLDSGPGERYVTSDTSNLDGTVSYRNKRVNMAYATDRTNAGVEATCRLRPWRSSLGAKCELEAMSRDRREANTTENRIGFTYRARPRPGVNLQARYRFGARDGTYDPRFAAAIFDVRPTNSRASGACVPFLSSVTQFCSAVRGVATMSPVSEADTDAFTLWLQRWVR